jgi:hypothetical protein
LLDEERAAQRYRVPREAASDCDDARLVHADLATLDGRALSTEESHVLQALAERDRPFHERVWLAERWGRLSAERCRRRAPHPAVRSEACEEDVGGAIPVGDADNADTFDGAVATALRLS